MSKSTKGVCDLIDECYQGRATIKQQAERIEDLKNQINRMSDLHDGAVSRWKDCRDQLASIRAEYARQFGELRCVRAELGESKKRVAYLESLLREWKDNEQI